MRVKKNKEAQLTLADDSGAPIEQTETGAEQAQPETPAIPTRRAESKERIAVPIKADGSIDLDSMRDSTKAKLAEAVSRSKLMSSAGGAAQPPVEKIPP